MVSDRLEVRLEPEQRRRLDELAADAGASVSQIIRDLLDRAYEQRELIRRRAAARTLGALAVEDVPEPEELAAQLDRTYESHG